MKQTSSSDFWRMETKNGSLLMLSQIITPVGPLTLGTADDGLHLAYFDVIWENSAQFDTANVSSAALNIMKEAKSQVQEYFAGLRKKFSVPIVLKGTPFQKKAWATLEKMNFGTTLCYEEQAELMDEPGKARAVGAANGKNPICLFIPCHRVIGKTGGLRGYAYGLKIKEELLNFEAAILLL